MPLRGVMALKGDLITAKERAGIQYESATDMFEAGNRPAGNTWCQSRRMGKLYCAHIDLKEHRT